MRNMLLKCLLFCLLLEVFTIVNAYAQQTKDQEIEQLKTENASLKKNLNEVYKENQALKIKNREWEYLFEVTTQELQLAIKKYIYAIRWSQGKTSQGEELIENSKKEFAIIMDKIKKKLTEYKKLKK